MDKLTILGFSILLIKIKCQDNNYEYEKRKCEEKYLKMLKNNIFDDE